MKKLISTFLCTILVLSASLFMPGMSKEANAATKDFSIISTYGSTGRYENNYGDYIAVKQDKVYLRAKQMESAGVAKINVWVEDENIFLGNANNPDAEDLSLVNIQDYGTYDIRTIKIKRQLSVGKHEIKIRAVTFRGQVLTDSVFIDVQE